MNDITKLADYFKVDVTDALSLSDKRFCEKQQQAYENALEGYRKLYEFREGMETKLDDRLEYRQNSTYDYLSVGRVKWSGYDIEQSIAKLHKLFIFKISKYFGTQHGLRLNIHEVANSLLPTPPQRLFHWKNRRAVWEQEDRYLHEMFHLSLHYRSVVEEIVWQLNGQNINEEAFHALQTECYMAAWTKPRAVEKRAGERIEYASEPKFRKKNQTIRFENACFYDDAEDCYRLNATFCSIIKGVAYYETKSFTNIPADLYELLNSYNSIESNVVKLSDCDKSLFFKFYKNGNVDLKFWCPEFAQDFAEDYLGLRDDPDKSY